MQERPQGASNGIVLSQLRYPVTVLRKAVAPLRRSNTKARGNLPVRARRQANINRVRRAFGGPACNTRLSPLSIISSARVLGIYVLKDVRFTREICCVFRRTEQTVRGDHRVAEVSRRHSQPEETSCVGIVHGGLTPAKARTVPGSNGTGKWSWLSRACSYRHHAAVAEMSVTSGSFRPGRADVVLSVPALISRTAGYAIRMVLWEGHSVIGVPIPINAKLFKRVR